MKALVLDGCAALRDMASAVEGALVRQLSARGYAVARHDLTSLAIPDCQGDFGCWTVTPGVCVHQGPHRDIARDLIRSDLAVWITPVTFGGYSSALKRQLDHCIPLVSPRFTTVQGETHHRPRYERFPDLFVLGLAERKSDEEARVFERLVRRNALNMHARRFLGVVIGRDELPGAGAQAAGWLDALAASPAPSPGGEALDLGPRRNLPEVKPASALLLVGSPRGRASVSWSLAEHLGRLLAERGLRTATQRIDAEDPGMADILVLATPLYVDSLPAPVTAFLETVSLRRALGAASRPRFLAIVNCGFPEAVHDDTALAICRQFAEQAQLDWVGGLGLGAGGMFAGKPLAELGGRARTITRALALTADALAAGRVVPDEARRLAATLSIPRWLYRSIGDWGFRHDASKHGVRSRMGDRPYAS